MDDKLAKKLRQVQALIAKADATDYPEEAATFRAKAEALMHEYRIEESMLAAAAPVGTGFEPVWMTWQVCQYRNEFRDSYRAIASWIMMHVGAQGVFRFNRTDDNGDLWMVAEVVGYESDLRYGEMLLTSATMAFGEALTPQYKPDESDQLNAYRMRKAGMEGWRIAFTLWGAAKGLTPTAKGVGRYAGKARRLYAAEAEARGENPRELMGQGTNVQTYRNSYAQGFADEMYWRLSRMRITKGEESQALVLAGRKEAVKEAFYQRFRQYRPTNGVALQCEKCKRAKSGHCRDHTYRAPKAKATNWQARSRGEDAARTVDLGGKGRLT